ncbi:VanZ family protein [Pseudonocardia sp. H11422]|uniref:VanZ family protein n=1 Tax=Pseudonocardia sp. H11422 TaxID=2835866 RepID=UPI001BDBE58E|nr:VanZ family protein [Pseudonocardia sp. H11422]
MASVVVLFAPASGVPSAPPGVDKLVHLLLFAALAGTGRSAGLPLRPLAVALVAYATASEVLQAVLPIGRSGDVLDALVDVAGIALGLGVVALARRGRRRIRP